MITFSEGLHEDSTKDYYTVSELIERLEKIKKLKGDIPVFFLITSPFGEGEWMEPLNSFEVVEEARMDKEEEDGIVPYVYFSS